MDRDTREQLDVQRDMSLEQIRAQGDQQGRLYAPSLHEQVSQVQAAVIEQVNPRKVVKSILLELDGKEINEDKEVVRIGAPYMNEEGLRMIRLKLRSVVNQGTIMSHFDENEIRKMMLSFAKDLTIDVGINWREYGVKDRTMCDTIMNIVLINVFAALKRAQEQNEKNWLGKVTFESVASQQKPQKKETFLSKLKL